MHITRLLIDSLGMLKNKELTGLTPGVNAIIGDNGAGKSTTRHAVGFSLFGIPAKKENEPFVSPTYHSAANPERRLQVILSDGNDEVKITRIASNGKTDGGPTYQPASAENLVGHYIGDASQEDFRNIWSMSEFDISSIDPQNSSTISKILAMSYGVKNNPKDIVKNLESTRKEMASVSNDGFGAVLDEYSKATQEAKLRSRSHEAFEADAALKSAEERIAINEEKRNQLRQERDALLAQQHTCATVSQQRADAQENIDALGEKLQALNAQQIQEPNRTVLELEHEITLLENQQETLFRLNREIEELNHDTALISQRLEHFSQTTSNLTASEARLVNDEAFLLSQEVKTKKVNVDVLESNLNQLEASHAAQSAALNEGSGPEKSNNTWLIALVVMVACIIAGIVVYLFTQSIPALVVLASVGLALGVFGLWTRNGTSAKSSMPSALLQQSAINLENSKQELSVAQNALTIAQENWHAFVERTDPTLTDLPLEEALRSIANLPEKIAQEAELHDKELRVLEKKDERTTISNKIIALYQRCFPERATVNTESLDALISECAASLKQQKALDATYREHSQLIVATSEKLEEVSKVYASSQAQLDELARDFDCQTEELSATLSQKERSLSEQIDELDEAITQDNREKGTHEEMLRTSMTLEQDDDVRSRLNGLKADLHASAHELCVTALASNLLEEAHKQFAQTKASALVAETNAIFLRMTQGAFKRVNFPLTDTDKLTVIDKNNNELSPDMLSAGTMRQLYLAVRLAIIKTYDTEKTSLPIVLDEVLSSFDEERRLAAIYEINELAKDHQIFYFSVRDDFIESDATESWNFVEISDQH